MTTTSQRLDAARKEAREARAKLVDAHTALPAVPAVFLAYLAVLVDEATSPTRVGPSLGTTISGLGVQEPRANRDAAAELKRIVAVLTRIGVQGMGRPDAESSRVERIVYGKDKRWKPTGASSTTSTILGGTAA